MGCGHRFGAPSYHQATRDTLRRGESTLKLSTASGVTKVSQICDCEVPALGTNLETRVLPKTPKVLSVHKLVEEGAEFWWNQEGAFLWFRGATHHLKIMRGVPLLPANLKMGESW